MAFDITTAINIMSLSAVAVFAVSGALNAARQRMDILGFMLIGTVTGLGGGTLRDLVRGHLPVFWVREPIWISICLIASAVTYFVTPMLASLSRALLWMDAVGLALFAVAGTEVALKFGATPLIAVCMGVMTASFGGIARDVLCRSSLTLMNEELYITTALAGSVVYLILHELDMAANVDLLGGFCTAFILRALAIKFKIKLPNMYK